MKRRSLLGSILVIAVRPWEFLWGRKAVPTTKATQPMMPSFLGTRMLAQSKFQRGGMLVQETIYDYDEDCLIVDWIRCPTRRSIVDGRLNSHHWSKAKKTILGNGPEWLCGAAVGLARQQCQRSFDAYYSIHNEPDARFPRHRFIVLTGD